MITSVAAVSTSQIPQGWDLQELLAALQASWWCTMLCRLARIVVRPYAGIKSAFDKSASSAASTSVKAARAAAAAAATALVDAEFEAKRPVDPPTPAAAPWKFSNVSIHTLEHVLPPVVVTARESMERLGWRLRLAGAAPDLLEKLTGIKERRMWEKGTTGVQAATWACRKAIEASGINPNRIGVICYTGVWRDFLEPGMAVCVHHELALPASCIALDVTNACVDWVNGLLTVASMIEGGVCDYALVVDAEVAEELYEATMQRMCSTLDFNVFKSQMATFTLGSGAVAAILCRSDLAPPGRNHRLTGAVSRCAPYTRDMCRARYEKMTTDTKMVLHGVKVVGQTWEVAQRELGMSKENVDLFVPHQVSKKAHTIGAHMLGISPDELVATYPFTGNVGPASIGIALSIEEKEGRVKEGQRVCLISFGSGINCIVAEVMW